MDHVSQYLRNHIFIPTSKWQFLVIIKQLWQQLQLRKVKPNNNLNKSFITIHQHCILLFISNI